MSTPTRMRKQPQQPRWAPTSAAGVGRPPGRRTLRPPCSRLSAATRKSGWSPGSRASRCPSSAVTDRSPGPWLPSCHHRLVIRTPKQHLSDGSVGAHDRTMSPPAAGLNIPHVLLNLTSLPNAAHLDSGRVLRWALRGSWTLNAPWPQAANESLEPPFCLNNPLLQHQAGDRPAPAHHGLLGRIVTSGKHE